MFEIQHGHTPDTLVKKNSLPLQEEKPLEEGEEITEMALDVMKNKIDQEKSLDRLKILETQLVQRKEKTITHIFNLLDIRRLKRKMGVTNESFESIQEEFQRALTILEEIKQENHDTQTLESAKEDILYLYHDELEKWKKILDCEQARDLANISKQNHAVFVHAFYTGGGQVTVMEKTAKWQDMYRVALSLEPQLATNTMRDGHVEDQPYYSTTEVGILIGGGYIQDAELSGTEVKGTSRLQKNRNDDPERLMESIKRSIGKQRGEYAIRNPKIAGLFIGTETNDSQKLIEVAKEATQSELPIYQRNPEDGFFGK